MHESVRADFRIGRRAVLGGLAATLCAPLAHASAGGYELPLQLAWRRWRHVDEYQGTNGHTGVDFVDASELILDRTNRATATLATGPRRVELAASSAVAALGPAFAESAGALILIAGARGRFFRKDSYRVFDTVRGLGPASASFVYGTYDDESLGDSIEVTLIGSWRKSGPHIS